MSFFRDLPIKRKMTLAVLGSRNRAYDAYGTVAASPGLWVASYGRLIALGPSGKDLFSLPVLTGALAAAPGVVWVLFEIDGHAGLARLDATPT